MPRYLDYIGKEEDICREYLEGRSKEKLRIKYRCHFGCISEILTQRGIAIRNASQVKQRYRVDEAYFDQIDTPEKAYLLGFLWADGSNSTQRHQVGINLSVQDEPFLHKIRRWLGSGHPIKQSIAKSGYGAGRAYTRLSIVNKRLSTALLRLGMHNDKTHCVGWPSIGSNLERHFIRGYIDGDGSWMCLSRMKQRGKTVPRAVFNGGVSIAVNRGFAQTFVDKIESHTGIRFGIGSHLSPVINNVFLSGRLKMIEFGKWLYEGCGEHKLDRKYQKYLDTVAFYSHGTKAAA